MHSIYRSAKSSFTLFGRYQLKPNIYESAAAAQHIATNNRRLSVGFVRVKRMKLLLRLESQLYPSGNGYNREMWPFTRNKLKMEIMRWQIIRVIYVDIHRRRGDDGGEICSAWRSMTTLCIFSEFLSRQFNVYYTRLCSCLKKQKRWAVNHIQKLWAVIR